MKKVAFAAVVAVCVSPMASASHSYWKEKLNPTAGMTLDLGITQLSSDFVSGTESAFFADYDYSKKYNFGADAQFRYMEVGGYDLHISNLGANYKYPLGNEGLYVKPEVGVFHAQIGSASDTNAYLGAELGLDSLVENFDVALYTTYYNFEYGEYWDESLIGAKMRYRFTDDFSVALRLEEAGILDGATLSVAYHF